MTLRGRDSRLIELTGGDERIVQLTGGDRLINLNTAQGQAALAALRGSGSAAAILRASGAAAFGAFAGSGSAMVRVGASGAAAFAAFAGAGLAEALASVTGAWYRVALATVTGSGVSSMPDVLNVAGPAIQTNDSFRPPRTLSGNGLSILQSVNDSLIVPSNAGTNSLVKWGFATHIALDNLAVQNRILRLGPGTINDPTAGDTCAINVSLAQAVQFIAAIDPTGANRRQGSTPSGVLNGTYRLLTVEFDGDPNDGLPATDAEKLTITVGTVVQSLSFAASGVAAAMPPSLQGTGDIILFNRRSNASSLPAIARSGPSYRFFKGRMSGVTEGLLTAEARTALDLFEKPS